MRKIILMIMLFNLGLNSYTQEYFPLVRENNIWNVLAEEASYFKKNSFIDTIQQMNLGCLKSSVIQSKITYITKLSSDSIIGELRYKKVVTSFDSLSNNWLFMGLIREDTIKQIVYYKDVYPEEQILYSFNVKVNDTIGGLVVKNIDTILINNKPRKRIYLNWGNTWVEGIGDLRGLLSPLGVAMCGPKLTLLCLTNMDSMLYKINNPNYKDCFYWEIIYTGMNSINDNFCDIYPNPANEFINIKFHLNGFYNIKLSDFQGKELINKRIQNSNYQLCLNNVKAGIYLLKIYNNTNNMIIKVIKK